jgi:hypothetical protein
MKNKNNGKPAPATRCAFEKMVDPKRLRLNPANPNDHPPAQLEAYGRVVEATGFRRAAIVSKRSGLLTVGHGLVLTALARGWPAVPVDFQQYADEADELAHMVADNQIARLSDLNMEKVRDVLASLPDGFDLALTGFDLDTAEALKKLQEIPSANKAIDEHGLAQPQHKCPKCGHKF